MLLYGSAVTPAVRSTFHEPEVFFLGIDQRLENGLRVMGTYEVVGQSVYKLHRTGDLAGYGQRIDI
jgi:hypothetical protein